MAPALSSGGREGLCSGGLSDHRRRGVRLRLLQLQRGEVQLEETHLVGGEEGGWVEGPHLFLALAYVYGAGGGGGGGPVGQVLVVRSPAFRLGFKMFEYEIVGPYLEIAANPEPPGTGTAIDAGLD